MKDVLFEYYKPEDRELKEAWGKGIFTFDANVLLNFYRYTPATTQELLSLFKALEPRIWLTNQAASEYLKNRLRVIRQQINAYDEVNSNLQKELESLISKLNSYKKHSTIEIDQIAKEIRASIDQVIKRVEGLKKLHPDYSKDDPILQRLTALFEKRVGPPFRKAELDEIFKDGKFRFEKDIPPGFKDKNTKKDEPEQSLYGDLVLWRQILAKAKNDKLPVILITDDLKEDWWDKFNGETLGPRKELLREFFEETLSRIYIYQPEKFLEYGNKLKVGSTVKTEAIREVRDVRMKDEYALEETRRMFRETIAKASLLISNEDENSRLDRKFETPRIPRSTDGKITDEEFGRYLRLTKMFGQTGSWHDPARGISVADLLGLGSKLPGGSDGQDPTGSDGASPPSPRPEE